MQRMVGEALTHFRSAFVDFGLQFETKKEAPLRAPLWNLRNLNLNQIIEAS